MMKQLLLNLYKLPSLDIRQEESYTMFCYRCSKELHENDIYYSRCGARRPQNYQKEAMAFGSNSSEEAIMYYFNAGYSYDSITIFLNHYHGISLVLVFELLKED